MNKNKTHEHSHEHEEHAPKLSFFRSLKHFALSGLASVTSYTITYPLETLKTRTQLHSECEHGHGSPKEIFKHMKEHEGIKGFYKGLFAALFHPLVCAASRLGLYFLFEDISLRSKKNKNEKTLTFIEKTKNSLLAGALGEIFVVPFDVVYVRYQADNGLPVDQRRGYTGIMNAFGRIIKEEGFFTLWRGTIPSIIKCATINFSMLTPYYECKERIAKIRGYNLTTDLISSALAGICVAVLTLPVDNIKVKLQAMHKGAQYKGVFDAIMKTYKNEGIRGFWSGLLPFYGFFAPNVMLTLIINDFLRIKAHLCHC